MLPETVGHPSKQTQVCAVDVREGNANPVARVKHGCWETALSEPSERNSCHTSPGHRALRSGSVRREGDAQRGGPGTGHVSEGHGATPGQQRGDWTVSLGRCHRGWGVCSSSLRCEQVVSNVRLRMGVKSSRRGAVLCMEEEVREQSCVKGK